MKYINIILAILISAGIFACDIVEAPYTKSGPVIPADTAKRKVLLEDFTGFRCGNCPEASHVAEQIADLYPNRVIVISLHAGPLAVPTPTRTYEFRTTETKELATYYGLIATPYGMINRQLFNGQTLQAPSSWAGFVTETLQKDADLKMGLIPSYNSSTKEISVDVKLDYVKNSSVNQYLAVYIVEDSVVQYQQDDRVAPNIHVLNYVHNHVTRASMNGTWGLQISQSIINAGNSVTIPIKFAIPANKDWRVNKLSLVAFVHDNDTKEILQVEKIKLLKD